MNRLCYYYDEGKCTGTKDLCECDSLCYNYVKREVALGFQENIRCLESKNDEMREENKFLKEIIISLLKDKYNKSL